MTTKENSSITIEAGESALEQLLKIQSLFLYEATGIDSWRYTNRETNLLCLSTSNKKLVLGVINGWLTFSKNSKEDFKDASGSDLSEVMKNFLTKLENSDHCTIKGKHTDTKFEFRLKKQGSVIERITCNIFYESQSCQEVNF